jgi:PqqD family protein of HPr-rel-A system
MPDHSALHWEDWDEQYAVFDARSGETHLLNTLAALVLRELCNKDLSVRELCEALADQFSLECNEEFLRQVAELITQFHHLGLVERCSA